MDTPLPTRSLAGRTVATPPIEVTRLGLGSAALGRPGYINLGHGRDVTDTDPDAMEAAMHRVLDAAWRAGVRYFDAARSYGRAEAFLGSWLQAREIPPRAVVIGSKWGYTYTADWRVDAETHEVKEHTLAKLREQWSETRTRLGAQLDLYQIHSATLESGVLERRDVLGELARLRGGHGVRIGLSLSGPRQGATLRAALPLRVDGQPLFDAVQATWNPLEPSVAPALADAHAAGVTVIVKEALANGRLTERGERTLDPDRRRTLRREAARHGVGVDAWAIAAALAQPWVDVVLSGAATADQLTSNLRAFEVGWDDAAAAVAARLAETPGAYWGRRSELPWT